MIKGKHSILECFPGMLRGGGQGDIRRGGWGA